MLKIFKFIAEFFEENELNIGEGFGIFKFLHCIFRVDFVDYSGKKNKPICATFIHNSVPLLPLGVMLFIIF